MKAVVENHRREGVQLTGSKYVKPLLPVLTEWHRLWLSLALLAALLTSIADAVLLHRKYQIFTGGFLSVSHLDGLSDLLLFGLASIAADMGITTLIVAITLWIFSKIGLNARPSILTVLVIAVTPILVVDFIKYQIHAYVGDAFDFALTFEIADRNPKEIFAVAATHLVAPIALVTASGAFVVFLIWMFKRYVPGWAPLPEAPGALRVSIETMTVVVLAALLVGVSIPSRVRSGCGLSRPIHPAIVN